MKDAFYFFLMTFVSASAQVSNRTYGVTPVWGIFDKNSLGVYSPSPLYAALDSVINSATAIRDGSSRIPLTAHLLQNYPNPFNPTTTIEYRIPMTSHVVLKVYDVLGREIRILVDDVERVGVHQVRFDASNLPSGVYFCTLIAGKTSFEDKLIGTSLSMLS